MAYTTEDATNVRAAILALASGTRKASVTFSSAAGSRTVQYAAANLADLRSLLELIEGELAQEAQPRSRTVLTRSRKGL
jgi:hypothetical protein